MSLSRLPLLFIFCSLALSAAASAQIPDTLQEATRQWDRVPVIVSFDRSEYPGTIDGPVEATADVRIAWQLSVIGRALGVPESDLVGPAAQDSTLRRSFRSVPLVSMLLTGDQINALLMDPAVASIQLDRVHAPTSNNTIPLVGAAALHSSGLTGAGATVAILDTGVDHEHPMFAGRIVESLCFSSNGAGVTSFCPGGVSSDTTTPNAGDDCPYSGDTNETPVVGCGHGTHVAGIAAGSEFVDPDSGDLLIGVAPEADIIAVNVFSRFTSFCGDFGLSSPCALSYTSDQIAALDWLYVNRASFDLAAHNMSLGGGRYTAYCNSDSRFEIIDLHRTAGAATSISSGNSFFNDAVGAPACIEPAVTVGATTDADVVAEFSNSSTMVDLLAPGVQINSAEPTVDDTLPGRARSISGTSMAAPHVAGAFALLRSANPAATVDQIEAALKATGVAVTEQPSGLTRPRIQVDAAYERLVYVVDTVDDAPDAQPDGLCDDGTGACTLRAAIQESNAQPGVQSIHFDVPGCPNGICVLNITTSGGNPLPDIAAPTVIDGSTQPGNAAVCALDIPERPTYRVVLQGDGAGSGVRLNLGSSGSVVRGLNVRGFSDNLAIIRSNDNVVECNFIGTDETGMVAAANPANGVLLLCDSTGNVIGGSTSASGNLISGHDVDGVQVFAGADCGLMVGNMPSNNAVLGNFIGVAKDGTTPLGNAFSGISFFGAPGESGADGNFVGVLQNGQTVLGNVIGDNRSGIFISGGSDSSDGSDNNLVLGNFLGTDRSGTVDLGNEAGGIDLLLGNGNRIGSGTTGHGNVIAFNAWGVMQAQDAGEGNTISANSIYANAELGIELVDATGTTGVTPNDPGDLDTGANRLQNWPAIAFAEEDAGQLTVVYDVDYESTPLYESIPLTVELFIADEDEGRTLVGSEQFTGPGSPAFVIDAAAFRIGDRLVATATDTEGNTSEFSTPISIVFLDRVFLDDFE